MSLLDPRQKTISLKVVYYGPGLGGKTTSLKHIHQVIDPEGKIKLVSLDTDEDRTLFFDFLPIELGLVGRFKIKIQGFTVPGQVKYNMTRRYVLTGADGIVFVADSDPSRLVENVESLINLGDNLRAHGLNVNNIPLVFQYNKQDLPNSVSPVELEEKLNFRKVPSYATIATKGDGVFEAFIAVSRLMVSRVIKTYNLKEEQADEGRILAEVESRLRSLGSRTGAGVSPAAPTSRPPVSAAPSAAAAAAEAISAMSRTGASAAAGPSAEDRTTQEAADFIESLQGNAAKPPGRSPDPAPRAEEPRPASVPPAAARDDARRAPPPPPRPERPEPPPVGGRSEAPAASRAEAGRSSALASERIGRDGWNGGGSAGGPSIRNLLRTLLEIGRRMAAGSPLENLATIVVSQACEVMEAMGGSLLVVDESGDRLQPLVVNGFRVDPILNSGSDEGRQLLELLDRCGDQLFISRDHHPELQGALAASSPDIEAALVLPLVVGNQVQGGLVVYLDEPLDLVRCKEPLKILVVLAYQLAVGLVLNRRQPEPVTPRPGP